MRTALQLFDFEDPSISDVKLLLLRAAFAPSFLRCAEGRRMVAYMFTLQPAFVAELTAIIKNQIPAGRKSGRFTWCGWPPPPGKSCLAASNGHPHWYCQHTCKAHKVNMYLSEPTILLLQFCVCIFVGAVLDAYGEVIYRAWSTCTGACLLHVQQICIQV